MYIDNQIAKQNCDDFILIINIIISRSREILCAHAKQKSMSDNEMMALYIEEKFDTFSPFIDRADIVHVLNLERQITDQNTLVATYTIGDCLLKEGGCLESFFALPNWTDVFQALKGAPHSRQGIVLQRICDYLISRLIILAALHQHVTQIS